jgi:hypothetical protein
VSLALELLQAQQQAVGFDSVVAGELSEQAAGAESDLQQELTPCDKR